MFEISTKEMRQSIREYETTEKELTNLLRRLNDVYSQYDSLVDGGADKRALGEMIEEVLEEKRSLGRLKQTLSEVLQCYEASEKKSTSTKKKAEVRNQFGLKDLSDIAQILDNFHISFK